VTGTQLLRKWKKLITKCWIGGRDASYVERENGNIGCALSGTTGLIAGGAGGAILGKALGGDTLGTLFGAIGGGLLGRHLDKKHAAQNYENGARKRRFMSRAPGRVHFLSLRCFPDMPATKWRCTGCGRWHQRC
jgi:hypothetical protein